MVRYTHVFPTETSEGPVFVAAMYADKPQGPFGQLARPCTWLGITEQADRSGGTGHAFRRPGGRGGSCST